MKLITNHDLARRLARTIISDITVYNSKKIKEGLKNDNLFDLLQKEIDQGRKVYVSRVCPEIAESDTFYDHAIVDIMFKQSIDAESMI
jgi:RecG-like helicase